MDKLFAVYLGGDCKGARIELHDLVFAIAPNVKASFPQLKKLWFGTKGTVHVDAWVELSKVDGYKVLVKKPKASQKIETSKKLYALNVGCYNKTMFGEEHHFFFLVGKNKNEVKARAKALVVDRELTHIDNFIDVDDIIELSKINDQEISLLAGKDPASQPEFHHVYWPIK